MENKRYTESVAGKILLNVSSVLLGVVFIFSGFVKAVDPLGTCYKITDYVEAFGMSGWMPDFLPLMLSVGLCCLEFVVGVMLLLRVSRKFASALALLQMIVMTPLTLYLALTNPISDCGCFGDALILTNWETFFKNVVLLAAAIIVFVGKDGLKKFLSPAKDWMVLTWALAFILGVAMYCLYYLPIIDFRPYKVGVNIPEAMTIPEDAEPSVFDTRFIMEKDGRRQEFALEDYPDSTWTFIDTKTVLVKQGYEPPIHDFSLTNMETGDDDTDLVLGNADYMFMLVLHRVTNADDSNIDLINEIYDYSVEHGYKFIAVTASTEEEIENWRDRTGAEYDFYVSDDIVLKTIVRSNPGLLLLKDGTILNKWSDNNLPDEFGLTDTLDKIPAGEQRVVNNARTLGLSFLIFILPLLFIAGQDVWQRRKKAVSVA